MAVNLENPLNVDESQINVLKDIRSHAETISEDNELDDITRSVGRFALIGLNSYDSCDIYEYQISKILNLTNITTKHGWDGNDDENNEPYEYKPTKVVAGSNYLSRNVSINDDSESKINNVSPHKANYNNEEANFVIAIFDQNTSDCICIYKFKDSIMKESRELNLQESRERNVARVVYQTSIQKCIQLTNEKGVNYYSWKNERYFT